MCHGIPDLLDLSATYHIFKIFINLILLTDEESMS